MRYTVNKIQTCNVCT